MKVEAAVLRASGASPPYADSRPLRIERVELDPPGAGEVLVRVLAAGLCHSDLSVIAGSRPRPLPMVLGHEACGEVLALGPDTDGVAVGDRVVFSFVPHCGQCDPCAEGRAALCEPGAAANGAGVLLGGARRWRDADAPLNHHLGISAFATHSVVSVRSLVRIDPALDPAIAALFGCAVLTGVGAITHTARVGAGESVAIFGLGGIGMAALLGALAVGAHPVVAIDRVPEKLAHARALGADAVLDAGRESAESLLAQLRDATHGGAQYAIETVGSEQVLAQAFAATRRGGTTVSVGLPDPSRRLSLPMLSLVAEERTLKGCYMGSSVPLRDIPRLIALHRAGRLPVERLLTHRLRFDRINEGFDRLREGSAIRQVVVFD
jgi:Zn-dependent alcohol dehydrogenase